MTFREDINSLRAISIVAVLFYHFSIPFFSGGFLGVDVFFVISGFLMTSIIVSGVEKNSFSLTKFYFARAKRIIPALLALCSFLLFLGWFWLPPADFGDLGKHVASSLSFISNFIYKGEEGYFDTLSQEKWLLHTWSLSLEWQFYIIYPVFLLFLSRQISLRGKAFRETLKNSLITITLFSFALSAILTPEKDTFSFYLLPTRIWELTAGGLAYLWTATAVASEQSRAEQRPLCIAGLVFILGGLLLFNEGTPWPGHAAALPVVGTVLVLLSKCRQIPFLSGKIPHFLGLWSYSIYLWHWPIIVFLRYLHLDSQPAFLAGGVFLSIVFGAASYNFLEQPIRKYAPENRRLRYTIPAQVIFVLLICASIFVTLNNGVPVRVSSKIQLIEKEIKNSYSINNCHKKYETDTCNKNISFAVWGDSHAGSLYSSISEAAASKNGAAYVRSACPPILNVTPTLNKKGRACYAANQAAYKALISLPREVPLFIAARWSFHLYGHNENSQKLSKLFYDGPAKATVKKDPALAFEETVISTLCGLAKTRSVYVVLPIPEMGINVPRYLSRQAMISSDIKEASITIDRYEKRNLAILKILERAHLKCGVHLLNPKQSLCKEGYCLGSEQGKPLYFDDDHLSETGNKKLVPLFSTIFEK